MMQSYQTTDKKRNLCDVLCSENNVGQKKGQSGPPQTCENYAQEVNRSKDSIGLQSWSNIIPDELLLRIFAYVVESDSGAVPVLCRYINQRFLMKSSLSLDTSPLTLLSPLDHCHHCLCCSHQH